MARTEINRLRDMLDAARKAVGYVSGLEFEGFVADIKTVDAVVRRLEVVGEAAKSVEAEFRVRYPQVPWSVIGRTRDRLIHHYFAVDESVVWQITTADLPTLIQQLESILDAE